MSLEAQRAVLTSRLEPSLRPLALVLAFYADKQGGSIWPGIRRLAQDLGRTERQIRRGMKSLRTRQVLHSTGRHQRVPAHGFDLARLGTYQPAGEPSQAAATADTHVLCQTVKPGHRQRTSTVLRQRTSMSFSASPILISDLNLDLNKNLRQCAPVEESPPVLEPGADAPVVPQPEPTERREERKDEEPERAPIDEPEPDPVFQSTPTFAVYRHLATDALQLACLERDDRPGNVAEHLKRLCAKQSLPYDVAIIRKAVDVAFVLRQKRAAATWATAKAALGPAHRDIAKVVAEACAHAHRPRDRAGIG